MENKKIISKIRAIALPCKVYMKYGSDLYFIGSKPTNGAGSTHAEYIVGDWNMCPKWNDRNELSIVTIGNIVYSKEVRGDY